MCASGGGEDDVKRPNGIVPKASRGVWAVRSRKGSKAAPSPEEITSIKLGIVPGGDQKRDRSRKGWGKQNKKDVEEFTKAVTKKKTVKALWAASGPSGRKNACRDPEKLNPVGKDAKRRGDTEAAKPRMLPDLSKK